MAVDPTGPALRQFLATDPDAPIVMLNLLRFAEGGRERYDQYVAHYRATTAAYGAKVVYFGYGGAPLIAEAGQHWDAVLLASYPSRRAFSDMIRGPAYQAGTHLRTEALVEAVLQPTVPAG